MNRQRTYPEQTARWEDSLLTASMQQAARLMPNVTLLHGEPDRHRSTWITPEGLAERDPGDRVIKRIAERSDATFEVAANYGFRYAISVALRLTGYLFATEQRVPLLRGNVLLHDSNWLNRVAVLEPRAVVLPGDELAGTPGVRTAPDHAALTDALFGETAAFVEPLLAGFVPRKLVARANGSGSALDYLAYGFQIAGRAGLGLDAAWQAWGQATGGRTFPTRRRPRRFEYEVDSAGDELLVRAGCCLYYVLPRACEGGEPQYCTSCFIQSDERRLERLVAYKRRLAAEAVEQEKAAAGA
ncbi:MAG: hypothetical protein ACRDJE_07100 [Dehalococcoidia bacterium]